MQMFINAITKSKHVSRDRYELFMRDAKETRLEGAIVVSNRFAGITARPDPASARTETRAACIHNLSNVGESRKLGHQLYLSINRLLDCCWAIRRRPSLDLDHGTLSTRVATIIVTTGKLEVHIDASPIETGRCRSRDNSSHHSWTGGNGDSYKCPRPKRLAVLCIFVPASIPLCRATTNSTRTLSAVRHILRSPQLGSTNSCEHLLLYHCSRCTLHISSTSRNDVLRVTKSLHRIGNKSKPERKIRETRPTGAAEYILSLLSIIPVSSPFPKQ